MFDDWQSPVALGICVLVALLFALRFVRRLKAGRAGTCGGDCQCPKPASHHELIESLKSRR